VLQRLTIEDFGLIARAEIAFAAGATMFTGETGSGKTMVLGAIGFVLGERAGAGAVRRGCRRAAVVLEFDASEPLRARFAADGFALDRDEEATISRELSESGKSTTRLNGRPATAGYLRELAAEIVDIAGQHEAQRLLSAAYHVELLDRFGGAAALAARDAVARAYEKRASLADELHLLGHDERRAREQLAFAQLSLAEIESAAPQPGEDRTLIERAHVMNNAGKIATALRGAQDALTGDQGSARDALGAAAAALSPIAAIGSQFAEICAASSALQSEIGELAARVAGELDGLEFNAAELDAVNARLDALETLKRKYGGSLEAVLQSVSEFRATTDLFEDADRRKAQLEHELQTASLQLERAAAELSSLRRAARERLKKAVERELKDLALASAHFDVHFRPLDAIGRAGAEDVEFLFAANKGERLQPLVRVASGGELSRVLLALVVVLAAARGRTALVFDEIDAGVGGTTATAVGVRLGRLAQDAQVVCVTHLAQIASWADAHYVLEKRETRAGTTIAVRPAAAEGDRAAELARMLSGETHDVAIKHARTLLKQAKERREAFA
jgi:DNA repair protein RecN (Recombination protein N)